MDYKSIVKKALIPANRLDAKKRLAYIDLVKLVAAFFTVFYHFAYYKLDYNFIENEVYLPNVSRIIMCLAACCVPLFFMTNGALLFSTPHSWKRMYMKAVKIVILTAVWSIVGFPSWFFKTLVILYLIFPVLQYAYQKCRILYFGILSYILIMPFTYNAICLALKIIWPARIISLAGTTVAVVDLSVTGFFTMYAIAYFLLGPVLVKKKFPLWLGITILIVGWILVTAECTIYTNLNKSMYDGVNAAFPTYGALLLSVGVFIVIKCMPLNRIARYLNWMGMAVLSIYLLHMLMIKCIKVVCGSFTLGLSSALLGTLFIFMSCLVIGKCVEKIPVLCWFMKV